MKFPAFALLSLVMMGVMGCSSRPPQDPITPPDEVAVFNPSAFNAHNERGQKLMVMGQFSQAADHYTALVGEYKGTPVVSEVNFWCGRALMGTKQYLRAYNRFEIGFNAHGSQAWRIANLEGMAHAAYFGGQHREAQTHLFKLTRQFPSSTDHEHNLYYLYRSSEALSDASSMALSVKQLTATYPASMYLARLAPVSAPSPGLVKPPAKSSVEKGHFIQCGIFKKRDNANHLMKRLKWNGFEPLMRPLGDKLHVILGYFPNEYRATTELKRLKRAGFDGIVKP